MNTMPLSRASLRLGLVLATLLEILLIAEPASAVPVFSRRYGIACGHCHTYPSLQLTGDGLDFLRRGHRMTGDKFEKDLSKLLSAHVEWQYKQEQGASTAFESPEFHLHAGGALSRYFSVYVDGMFDGAFESIYLQYTAERGDDAFFTTRVGKISPTLVRNYGNGMMASASTPLILTDATLGDNPFTPARDSLGIDVGGAWKRLFFQAGVLNGEDVPGQATVGNHKDLYATAELTLRDGVTGAGLLYFRGGYDLGDPSPSLAFDRYDRYGAFGNFTRDRFRLAGAYLYGIDRLDFQTDRKLRGYYAQGDLLPASWAVPFARYEDVRTEVEDETVRLHKATIGCAFRAYETVVTAGRIVLEASRTTVNGEGTNAALVGFLWAF